MKEKVLAAAYLSLLIFLVFTGCETESKSGSSSKPEIIEENNDYVSERKLMENCDTFPVINYSKMFIGDNAQLSEIRAKYGNSKETYAAWRAFTTLNRREMRFFRVGDTIVVPDKIVPNLLAYSVFPQCYPAAADIPKIILVSNAMQCYACYEYGRLVRFAAANTGKERTPTFPGRYALVWKERLRRSSLDSNWVMPFTWNFHPHAGNAFHQFEMPGRPVSHSCVRQFIEDAEWLYKWGQGSKRDSLNRSIYLSGTPVLIIDVFDYARRYGGPWRDIASNKEGILELPDDPLNLEEALIPMCQIPKDSRGSLVNYRRFLFAEDTLRARGIIREGVKLIETVDFNKLRREKAARAAREKIEKEKREQEENFKEKLDELNGENYY